MTRALPCCFLTISLCTSIVATGQSPQAVPDATLQLNTNLVVVDVAVTDANQRPVHNLTAANFNLREDGQPQRIKTFEEHTADETIIDKPSLLPPPPKLAPGVFTNVSPIPETGSLNIVLLDKLNTPMEDQAYSLNQLSQYLKTAPAGTRIAVATLTTGQLSLLQGFTSNPELLRAALSSKKAKMNASLLLNNPVSGGGRKAAEPALVSRREMTLNALNELGRYLSGFPGRKNLIWFSSSFPISMFPDGRDRWETTSSDLDDEFKKTVNLLAFNRVAVYAIDARGLVGGSSWFDASNAGPAKASVQASNQGLSGRVQSDFSKSAQQKWAMMDVADPTGGQVYLNTNDLKAAVAQAIDAGSNYYTLTYSPTSSWDGQYRKIKVQLDRQGLTLAYRRGYYAIDPEAPEATVPNTSQKANSTQPAPYSVMRAAMAYGAPEPAEIQFEADVRPSTAGTEPAVAKGNQTEEKVKGPYQRYSVHYIAHQRDIKCPAGPGGVNICAVEFAVCVYDADGRLINSLGNEIKANINSTYYAALRKPGLDPGFQYHQEISVPVKGEYYLRVGVHDMTTNKVGALELPISVVSALPPLSTMSADPASGASRK